MTALSTLAAPRRSPFRSFMQGGFEASSHRRRDGRQLDVLAACRHDEFAGADYRLLRQAGIRTARDALRWHRIETAPGRYDWSSFLPMLREARAAGVQVVWDLCHYGVPDGIDVWSAAFVDRFAAFCAAAARVAREEGHEAPIWCPMNEISFWSWAGGDKAAFYPCTDGQGHALKRQLVRAAIAGTEAARAVDSRARFMQPEPVIHITHHPDRPWDQEQVELYRLAQYQAWDMIAGRLDPDLGGREDLLDIVGVNFYFNNQWVHEFETMGMGHRLYRPFAGMLREVHDRYRRPLIVAETGAEGANGPGWLRYVAGEVRAALRAGVPMQGLCIYPVMDYPGWDDERHCPCGLIRTDPSFRTRTLDPALARQIEEEQTLLLPLIDVPRWVVAAE